MMLPMVPDGQMGSFVCSTVWLMEGPPWAEVEGFPPFNNAKEGELPFKSGNGEAMG